MNVQFTAQKFKYEKPRLYFSSKTPEQLTTEFKDKELAEMSEREFRSLLLTMINDVKEDSNKQINEVRKSFKTRQESQQHGKKFNREIEIMRENKKLF
jgi:methionyl-tRNA synthetase